jgi:hypothetical protein
MESNGPNAMYDATMDGLFRSGLIHMSAADQSCPGTEVVAGYYEHSLDAKEAADFESHLSRCGRCREQVAMMVRADEAPASPARQSFWLWDWRLLSPAIAALLILTIWSFRHSPLSAVNHQQADQPLVAMSRSPQNVPSNAPVPEPPATPPNGTQTILIGPQTTQQSSPKAKSEMQNQAPKIDDNQLQTPQSANSSPPLNGRNLKDLQPSAPPPIAKNQTTEKQNAKPRDEVAALKKNAQNEAAPSPSAIAPRAISGVRASESPAVLADRQSAAPDVTTDQAAKAQSAAPARKAEPELKTFATANAVAGAVAGPGASAAAQTPAQHSGSTIIQTPDPKILWRVAGGNFVERTENGGSSWQGQAADPDAQLTAGSAPSTKTCWLVGKAGMILVTKDAQHWKKLPPPVPADFVAVEAKNNSAATVTAADGQKFSTENEGKKWVPVK